VGAWRKWNSDFSGLTLAMNVQRYVYWEEDGLWLGYFEEFPCYLTEGETLEGLQASLKDLYAALVREAVPRICHVAELQVA